MAMNLIATADALKNLSDAQLRQSYMGGQVPQFLVLTEMQNRQKIRQAYQGQDPQAAQDTTIADKLLQGVGALPTSASIAANMMLSQNQGGPGSPGADAAVPPGGSNPSAMGTPPGMGPGGGTPMKPAAPGGSAQGFQMGMGGAPKGFAEGGRVSATNVALEEGADNPEPSYLDEHGNQWSFNNELMDDTGRPYEYDRLGYLKGRISRDDADADSLPPSSKFRKQLSNTYTGPGERSKKGMDRDAYDPKFFWNDKKVGIYDLYQPGGPHASDPNARRAKKMYADGGRVGMAGGSVVPPRWLSPVAPMPPTQQELRVANGIVNRAPVHPRPDDVSENPAYVEPTYDPPAGMATGPGSEIYVPHPGVTPGSVGRKIADAVPPLTPQWKAPARVPEEPGMAPGEVIPQMGRPKHEPAPLPAETEDRQDRAGITTLPTPARGGGIARPTGGAGGGGGGGGGGGTQAGGGGSAGRSGRPDLAAMLPDRFGAVDEDVAQQRKELAEAKANNTSNALIRMGSAMMEGGAKSGNFLGIAGLGIRSGQEEMTTRQAQQEKMRQAILEGSIKTATGRTQRDDALAKGETNLYHTDVVSDTQLQAARIAADAHVKAAAAGAGSRGDRDPVGRLAAQLAAAENAPEITADHYVRAGKILHPSGGGNTPMDAAAHYQNLLATDPKAAAQFKEFYGTAHGALGAEAREHAARIAAADKAEARVVGSIPYAIEKDPRKQRQMVEEARSRAMSSPSIPNVADQ